MSRSIKAAFRPEVVILDRDILLPSWELHPRDRKHEKYRQIAASVKAVGVIEPIVVFPSGRMNFQVLDGHKRLDVRGTLGVKQIPCIISTDDESYTYNKRVNYLSPVSEHQMILRALEHNTEETVAKALNVNIATIRKKCELLRGVCKEAVDLLKDRRVSPKAFATLRKMKPVRQVESAQLMIAYNMYSARFAVALLAGTKVDMLVDADKDRVAKTVTAAQKTRMEQETDALLQNFKAVEASYGAEVLTLGVSCRYVGRMLNNSKVRQHIELQHP